MSLSGNLRTMDLPEILQWISMGRKTGTLHLGRRSVEKRIAFREGSIYTSWSNDPRESLGQFLVREHRLTEEQLFRALQRQEREGQLLGSILVSAGLLSEAELRQVLEAKAQECIYDLFLWPEGRFEFKDGELPAQALVPVELAVTNVVLEGIRRVDEWKRIRAVFPSSRSTFGVSAGKPEIEDPIAREALELAASGKTLAEIALLLRRSEFDAASLLFGLHQQGRLIVEAVDEAQPTSDPIGSIKDLLAIGRQRLQEKRFDAAMAAYEQVLALDRLNQHAKEGLIAVAEARQRERAMRSVPLARVPVLRASMNELTQQNFDPQEGFVLSRVNGEWDVRSILKLCPMAEEDTLLIFARLLERGVIELS